jgi:hypothetical protein
MRIGAILGFVPLAIALAGCGSVERADDEGGAADDGDDDDDDAGADDGADGQGTALLSVAIDGPGAGAVTSAPEGIDCPRACSASFDSGTTVVLSAVPASGSRLAAWSVAGCGARASCEVELAGDTEVTATFAVEPNLAFVTSQPVESTFGGLTQADAICSDAAAAAGLEGTYIAWLSTSAVDAIDRLAGASGWVRTDGAPFADTPAGLAAGEVFHPLRLDENGAEVLPPLVSDVWTGTGGDGIATNFVCDDWTSPGGSGTGGSTAQGTEGWTSAVNAGCGGTRRLYCLGVDRAASVRPPPPGGRIAFLSAGNFAPEGLAAADSLCAGEAEEAGLEGEFVAFLATQDGSAIDRVGTNGSVWTRPDGVALAADVAAFLAGPLWETSISQTAAGDYVADLVWTGAVSPTLPGDAVSTCGDWLSPAAGTAGTIGRASAVEVSEAFAASGISCQFGQRIYCLQR